MQFTMPQPELARALALVSLAVSPRNVMPILGNILIAADADAQTVTFSATNLETGLVITLATHVAASGTLTLPSRLLRDTVGAIPSAARIDITLAAATSSAQLTYNNGLVRQSQAVIRGLPADEFPLIPRIDGPAAFTLPASELLAINRQSAFAAADSGNGSHPALTGVLWRAENGCLTAAATDGYRLAIVRRPVAPVLANPVIVPGRALAIADKLAAGADEIAIRIGDNRIEFTFLAGSAAWPGARLVCQLIPATFPDFTAIIPKTTTTGVELPIADFKAALKMAALYAADSSHRILIEVRPGLERDGALAIKAVSAETGQFDTELAVNVEGPGIAIAFASRYLLEGLNAINEPLARIEFTRPDRPAAIRADGFEYICMPMQMKQ